MLVIDHVPLDVGLWVAPGVDVILVVFIGEECVTFLSKIKL
jgi:hypothetical protein